MHSTCIYNVWWPQLEAELRSIELYPYGLFDVVKRGILAIIDSTSLPIRSDQMPFVVVDTTTLAIFSSLLQDGF